ncbi:MAG: monovalent cation/H(+) antiporter subunit G [Sphingomonadales bacterium]
MSAAVELPVWAAALVGMLLVSGAGLAFVGSLGLLRMRDFYARLHPPTIGTSFGTLTIGVASMIFFTMLESRLVIHELLIVSFVTLTTPISLILLVTASRHRVPPNDGSAGSEKEST